jgi:hypothetical protein
LSSDQLLSAWSVTREDPGERVTSPLLSGPQPKLDVLRSRTEVAVRAEQDEIVLEAELDENGVDRSDLDAAPPAAFANFSGLDVVVTLRLQESERGKPLDQLPTRLGSGEALEKFLQDQTGREDLIGSLQGVSKSLHFRRRRLGIAAEGEGPDAGIDKKAHGWRVRSAL